jgi:phosphoglycerate kinase
LSDTTSMSTIEDLGDVRGKRVLVRSDLNVPIEDGVIGDDGRIRASVPTIADLAGKGARVIVCAHLGRPKGKPEPAYTLKPVAARLGELLGKDVRFADDTVGASAKATVDSLADGDVALLENLRFNAGETSKDEAERTEFAHALAAFGDAYVDDAFGAVHRKHASVYDVAQRLPHAAGGLVLSEVEVLRKLTESPAHPYAVVLGGAKVSDKLGVIDNLLDKADLLLIGGGMVFTFLAAQGYEIGRSLLEDDQIETVKRYLSQAGDRIVLPVDVVAATAVSEDAEHSVVSVEAIPADRIGVDIGPASARLFGEKLLSTRTVFWNGPMGVAEIPAFAAGTKAVAEALTKVGGLTVVGGGDSAAAVRQLGFPEDAFGHISTGGGASLEYLEGKTLPGLAVLED